MTSLFVDSSAIAKRYLIEMGTNWLRRQVQPSAGNTIIISELALIEVFSVLARRQREGTHSIATVKRLGSIFLKHANVECVVIGLTKPIFSQARKLVTQYPLRTLDAIQLVCALRITILIDQPITFLSADKNLLAVAAAIGFATDNPSLHF